VVEKAIVIRGYLSAGKLLAAFVIAVGVLSSAGCTQPQVQPPQDITGEIVSFQITKEPESPSQPKPSLGTILVQAREDGAPGNLDKASVTITTATRIYEQRGQDRNVVSFDWIMVGQQVQVWFSGPVRESDPVQATAREIAIIRP